jgi:formate hydrogenlyase subunit 3/multisubunit Na+/H+ antiporter MnhD subunit
LLFALLLGAIAGFPPFPGFFAKWHLLANLAADERYAWIVIVLLGSLLEAAYLFRWFGRIVQPRSESEESVFNKTSLIPAIGAAFFVTLSSSCRSPRAFSSICSISCRVGSKA